MRKSDQLEVRVVQQLIVEDAPHLLNDLRLRSDPTLAKCLETIQTSRKIRAQHGFWNSSRRGAIQDERTNADTEAFRRLRHLLEHDQNVQARTLEAVKKRISRHYQYNPTSVPFELFQNADDASAERYEKLVCDTPANVMCYHIGTKSVAVQHYGRCINQVPAEASADPASHPWSDDLWKMIVLGLSNKQLGKDSSHEVEVTGEFGLGFKSVFLCSRQPRILSGQLVCEISGGLFPKSLDRRVFDKYLNGLAPEVRRATTIIELPLDDEENGDFDGNGGQESEPEAHHFMERFVGIAHVLVVFARHIRRIELLEERAKAPCSTFWQDEPVPGVSHCFTGVLVPFPDLGWSKSGPRDGCLRAELPKKALVLRTSTHCGALLLVHDGRKFQPLPDDVPTLWVTAPTGERLKVGFALNARFSLDPGRAQLGRESPENDQIALELGRELGQRFVALFEHQQRVGWGKFCEDLGLDARADQYEFWDSLWELLGPSLAKLVDDTSDAGRILRAVFWGPDGAASRLYRECAALPARLKGARFRNVLTAMPDVRLSVSGILAEDDGYCLMCVYDWPAFVNRVSGGHVISERLVAAPLRPLMSNPESRVPQACGLTELLSWEVSDLHVSVKDADRFGKLFVDDAIKKCERHEEKRLIDVLRQFGFKNRSGDFELSGKLLVGHQPHGAPLDARKDERMRAAFAPKNRVLSGEYTAAGVAFFELCRERLDARAEQLAEWVLNASDDDARSAARNYLAEGELGRAVQRTIKDRGGIEGTWLEDIAESQEFKAMSAEQRGQLVGLLSEDLGHLVVDALLESPVVLIPQTHRDPGQVLGNIYNWWQTEGHRRTANYERRTYPNGGLHYLIGERDERFRKDWSVLFLIGLTHTMGRTVAQQHRDFLRKCDHEGYLDMIADSEREPSNWMKWIDDFLDRQIDDSRFLQWMKQFVGIYQVSRHLDIYIGAFESVNQIDRQFELTQIVNPRSSVLYQGGGFDAPPLSRVLGMGQCFVLRELVRNGIIKNNKAHQHCYVPVKRVRDLLMYLGCDGLTQATRKWELSREIHRFLCDHIGLEKARFNLAFDIPLQIIAEDEDLQARFLDDTVAFDDTEDDLWSMPDGVTEEAKTENDTALNGEHISRDPEVEN